MSYDRVHAHAHERQRLALELARVRAVRRRGEGTRHALEWLRWIGAGIALVTVAPFVTFTAGSIVWPTIRASFGGTFADGAEVCESLWHDATNTTPVVHDLHVEVSAERTVFPLHLYDPDEERILEPRLVKRARHGDVYVWPTEFGRATSLAYAPDPGFVGTDSFVFDVTDGRSRSRSAEVAIVVHEGRAAGTEYLSREATR